MIRVDISALVKHLKVTGIPEKEALGIAKGIQNSIDQVDPITEVQIIKKLATLEKKLSQKIIATFFLQLCLIGIVLFVLVKLG